MYFSFNVNQVKERTSMMSSLHKIRNGGINRLEFCGSHNYSSTTSARTDAILPKRSGSVSHLIGTYA